MESADLLGALVEATLATSAAVALVLLMRRRLRGAFGARVAYGAWLLVPAALVAVFVPAAVQAPVTGVTSAAPVQLAMATTTPVVVASPLDTSLWWLAVWTLGTVAALGWMARLQRRFRHDLGPLRDRGDGLHEAAIVAGLPAAMGLVRPRIVVPADFERRYDHDERELMHVHERMHIRAGDLHSNALASALRCAFWFNPLIHAAWFAFRHDQELACDQRVIALYPHARRRYGEAMFKTQLAAQPLPLACHWGFGHPLKERIAMLTRPVPSRARFAGGVLLMTSLALGVGFTAWSAQPARTLDESMATPAPPQPPVAPALPAAPAFPAPPALQAPTAPPATVPFLPPPPAKAPVAPLPPVPPSEAFRIGAKKVVVHTVDQTGGPSIAQRLAPRGTATIFEGSWEPLASDGTRVCNGTVHTDETHGRMTCVADADDIAAPDARPSIGSRASVPTQPATFARISRPVYPKDTSLHGRVIMEVDVGADGQVADAKVARSSGHAALDDAARMAVMKWRFNPAYNGGVAVASRVRVPIDFGPDGSMSGEAPGTLDAIQVNR